MPTTSFKSEMRTKQSEEEGGGGIKKNMNKKTKCSVKCPLLTGGGREQKMGKKRACENHGQGLTGKGNTRCVLSGQWRGTRGKREFDVHGGGKLKGGKQKNRTSRRKNISKGERTSLHKKVVIKEQRKIVEGSQFKGGKDESRKQRIEHNSTVHLFERAWTL